MNFRDDVYRLLYGDNVDVANARETKSVPDVYHDLTMLLADNDITKYNEVRKLEASVFLTEIENRIKTRNIKTVNNINPIGFKK